MLEFTLNTADKMYWGRAKDYGSFGYGLVVAGISMSLFTYYSGGTIYLNLGTLKSKIPEGVFEKFVETVAGLRGFERAASSIGGWPQFQTRDTLADESVRTGFKNAVLAIQSAILGTLES